MEFTKKNKNNVCNAIEGKKSIKKLSPAEWHQFVQNYNYDDGVEPFFWLAKQPSCDKGTALCLYWHLSPTFKHNNDTTEYKLLREIETRFLSGFYENEQFSFDPHSEFLTAGTDVSSLPIPLTQKTNGEPFERLDIEFAFLRYPNEKEYLYVSKKVASAICIIKNLNPQFEYIDPDNAVTEIVQTINYYKSNDREKVKIKDLSFLWLDSVHKKHGWDWVMWDWETGANFGVSNQTRAWTCLQNTIIKHTISGFRPTEIIWDLYYTLADINKVLELNLCSGIGLLFSSEHLKFQLAK